MTEAAVGSMETGEELASMTVKTTIEVVTEDAEVALVGDLVSEDGSRVELQAPISPSEQPLRHSPSPPTPSVSVEETVTLSDWQDGDVGSDGSTEFLNLIETCCAGCGAMFSHNPSAVIDTLAFCHDECAAGYRQSGESDSSPQTVAVKQDVPRPGSPLVSKILDTVMMDVVGDVPDDDPKTKLGRLKRQLEIKMAVPGETFDDENPPMSKRPRQNSEADSEVVEKNEEEEEEVIGDRESKRLAEIRMKLSSEDAVSFQKREVGVRQQAGAGAGARVAWFPWKGYLNRVRGRSAPATYFSRWTAPQSNDFQVGMLLEVVDQASGSERRVVLARVADVISVRLLLSLVGCPDTHPGQVVDIDSPDIHPIGWSRSQGREMGIPVGACEELLSDFAKFRNEEEDKADWAPPSLFSYAGQIKPRFIELPRNLVSNSDDFLPGQRLEVVMDDKSPKRVRVARVDQVFPDEVTVLWDGDPHEQRHLKKFRKDSRLLHPVGFCYSMNHRLLPPRGMPVDSFNWAEYLRSIGAKAAPPYLFKKRNYFRIGMKLEAVDPKHPLLICIATVAEIKDHQIKIHFDDCDIDRDVWIEADSRSIFPCGWCEKINHPLEAPSEYLGSISAEASTASASSSGESSGIDTPSDASFLSDSVGNANRPDDSGSPSPSKNWNSGDGAVRRASRRSVVSSPSQTSASSTVSQDFAGTTISVSPQPKIAKVSLDNATARKSTSGRMGLPLSPQLSARQERAKLVLVPAINQSPFRIPAVPPQRGSGSQQLLLLSSGSPQARSHQHTTSPHKNDTEHEVLPRSDSDGPLRIYFNMSKNVSTGSMVGRRKLCFLPSFVGSNSFPQLTAKVLQAIVICSDRPLAVLKAMPHGDGGDGAARVLLEQVGKDSYSVSLPKCDNEVGMFRVIHQALDAAGCSRDLVSKVAKRDGDPSVFFSEMFRVPKPEEAHIAHVDTNASPLGPILLRSKLKKASTTIYAGTYPELGQRIVQFLVNHSRDPKVICDMVPEAKAARQLYISLPDGSRKSMQRQKGFYATWNLIHRILQVLRCSPDFLTPYRVTETPSDSSKAATVSGSPTPSVRADIRPGKRVNVATAGTEETTSGHPVAFFNTSVETGPRIVPSLLFQLPEKVVADSYIELVRRIIQAISAVAVSPNVVFECLDDGSGRGEHFSILWKDEHGQLHTQAIAVENTHGAAWRLIGRLLDRLGCSPQFVVPQRQGASTENVPALDTTEYGPELSSWPVAVFDSSVNTGPMLDIKKLNRLPERLSASTHDFLHKRLVQMMVDSAVRPEQVFWLIPGGSSQAEVTCQTSGGDLLRRKLRSCGSVDVVRRYVESFLINIRCSPKFIRIGNYAVGNKGDKTKTEEMASKPSAVPESMAESSPSDEPPNTVSFVPSPRSSPLQVARKSAVADTGNVSKSPKVSRRSSDNTSPENWSVSDVAAYFRSTSDCQELAPVFQKHEIDGSALLLLDRDALVQFMNVKVGPTLKVLRHVNKIKEKYDI